MLHLSLLLSPTTMSTSEVTENHLGVFYNAIKPLLSYMYFKIITILLYYE